MEHTKFVALDIETTGLDMSIHEIIQIGCVLFSYNKKTKQYKIDNEFEIKIKPKHIENANKISLKVNKYNTSDWQDAITIEKALKTLSKKLKDRVMVGHNAGFDYHFLNCTFNRFHIANTLHYHVLDTLSLAYGKLQNSDAKRLSLQYLSDYFGIENKKAHTALADARATYELFVALMK